MHRSRPQFSRRQQSCLLCIIFVDLQDILIERRFVVKKFAALKDGFEFSHYIFGCSKPWSNLIKAEKQQTMCLIENHHGI